MAEIDGWHATSATHSYEGPALVDVLDTSSNAVPAIFGKDHSYIVEVPKSV